nr:RHS repeat-associated core domain-containing protein [Streptomyces sp. 2BBP-J2]
MPSRRPPKARLRPANFCGLTSNNYLRHYDPETARYLTPDPLGQAPTFNVNACVANPYTWCDSLGLAPDGCPNQEHLFRGTTRGFDASSGTQESGYTPTSTDPGVATAFARLRAVRRSCRGR